MGKKAKKARDAAAEQAVPAKETAPASEAVASGEATPASPSPPPPASSDPAPPPPPRRRKLVYWLPGLLLVYAVAGFLILPLIIRSVAVKQLSKQLDREVSIQKVKLNPFAFSTAIRGLLIKDKDGEPFVSWDEVYVNFQLSSFLGHPWVFKKISVTGPFVRAQMNKDGTFNFSDLITKFTPTNAPAAPPKAPAKPVGLRIGLLQITNATASVTDLTHRTPFKRIIGPLNFTLEKFRTDPDNKNPHTFTGTTDAGETITWSGFFHLDPLRSRGELTLENLPLNKYTPLVEERIPFEIRDGLVGLHVEYRLNLGSTNKVMAVTNTSFTLRDFKLAEPGAEKNLVELAGFAVTGVNADAVAKRAEIGSVSADGGRFYLLRTASTATHATATNAAAPAQPPETTTNAPGGIPALLGSLTNAVARLLQTTNLWIGTVRDVAFTNLAFHLEDLTASRPARLDLNDIALSVKNISNLPETNLTVGLSLRWNTNGAIKTDVAVSLTPLTADVPFALDRLDFGTLDPFLESKLNLFIPDSQFGLHGLVQLRTPEGQLPEISFRGDTWIDGLRVVDGAIGEDLLKWNSVRVSGIEANVNPIGAKIREIALDNVSTRLVIETNRTINLLAALKPAGATNVVADTNAPAATNATVGTVAESARSTLKTAGPATLPPVSIGTIVISNNSAGFTDRSITPNVNMAILEFGGIIAGLSSSPSERAEVNLRAKVDGVGPVDISGHINPFSMTGNKDLKVTLKDMDLTPASPYSGKFVGYRIARGKLNLDLDYDIVERTLKSKNVIKFDRFTFGDKVVSPDATSLPVRLAIALLKDRNGQILLDVPVEGSLDDPKFRVGKVVWSTVLNILTKAATSPFSLLGALVGGGEELSYQDFAPGTTALSPDNQKKLDSLVKALYERPALQLEIAGSIDPEADRDALRRANIEKQIRSRIWNSLSKSERAATKPDQLTLTPNEYSAWVKKLYSEAVGIGVINPAFIAANTNLAAVAAQIKPVSMEPVKGATRQMRSAPGAAPSKSAPAAIGTAPAKPVVSGDPMEIMLMATIPVSDADFRALAAERAKAVRAYLLQTGKVETERLFISESQTGSVRSDGSRVYLQFQ
jgi:hypothetical protein